MDSKNQNPGEKKRWSRSRRTRRRKRHYNKDKDGNRQDGHNQDNRRHDRNHNNDRSHGGRRRQREDYPPLQSTTDSQRFSGSARIWTRNQITQKEKVQHITIFQKAVEGYRILQSFPKFSESPVEPMFN